MAMFLLYVALFMIVDATYKHHPKFARSPDDDAPRPFGIRRFRQTYRDKENQVACSSEHDRLRYDIIEKTRCEFPKEVFMNLESQAAHEQVSPGAVWVKRCMGQCDWEDIGSTCTPIETVIRHIPVRIYNVKTDRDTCSTYPVEEHVACGCCDDAHNCTDLRVFNPLTEKPE